MFVLLHGIKGRNLIHAKNLIKNVLESMVCLFIKDTVIAYKKLGSYLKKATLYPVHFSPFADNVSIVISKDNILKQLVGKSASFMKYIGL